ncbi:MAG: hypothetical protein K2X81_26595 [Candidatus Obscuribacterales bacterium]|nr:hypothetical protein [Candidatus Obscuribacterales bacterium]
MPAKEALELELKSATSSYLAMPMWMMRIEEKMRITKAQSTTLSAVPKPKKVVKKPSRRK